MYFITDIFSYFHPQTKFHIIDKRSGAAIHAGLDIIEDAIIVLHHINAYEENGMIAS